MPVGLQSGREDFRFRFVNVRAGVSAISVGGAKPSSASARPIMGTGSSSITGTVGTSSRPPHDGHRPTRPGFAPAP